MHKRPYIVGIAGASCSGKTALAEGLAQLLGPTSSSVTRLCMDRYYRDLSHLPMPERAAYNFDEPHALDHEAFARQLGTLASGQPIDAPTYDFQTHARLCETTRITPGAFVIVEGLFALYWRQVRDLLGLSVFIDADHEVCLARRLARDTRERGRTEQSVRTQYAKFVRPMYERHALPTRAYADLVVTSERPVAEMARTVAGHIE